MCAGYSSTPLLKKLGIKQNTSIAVVNARADYWDLLGELPEGVSLVDEGLAELAHIFLTTRAELERDLARLKRMVGLEGVIWVSWPKKPSGKATDLTENVVREIALAARLVDVKVCAVDETWSALKLVTRLKAR